MRTPNEFAEQIFEVLSFSINQACNEQDWYHVRRDALAYGFKQTDVSTTSAYGQRFDLLIEPGIYLCLQYRSFDPSGPFQNLPVTNKFELTFYTENGKIKSHQNSFDDPVAANDKSIWHELSFA
ncbi:hypothetical protein ACFQ2T_09310 [Methylophilus flavus]|uniref:Uncharacterized protein n=1 Tax=Methylophilus flavus TaxID=640084 RepID=A0ABW3PE52_9PROT